MIRSCCICQRQFIQRKRILVNILLMVFSILALLGSIYLKFDKYSVENITGCQFKKQLVIISHCLSLCSHFLLSSYIPPYFVISHFPLLSFNFIKLFHLQSLQAHLKLLFCTTVLNYYMFNYNLFLTHHYEESIRMLLNFD